MELLKDTIESIKVPDRDMGKRARLQLEKQARPTGSLGILEDIAVRLAEIAGSLDVNFNRKVIVTCAGDHGVTRERVNSFPPEVTRQMVYNFIDGGASVSVLARQVKAEVHVADLGVNHDFEAELPIFHSKIGKGTCNMSRAAAMSREEAVASIEAGIRIVNELYSGKKVDLLGGGDMGIGNTTPSSAIIAVFSGFPPEKVTGRGAGLDDAGLKRKVATIERSLEINNPDPSDPIDVLAKIGGYEIGALGGLLLGAAASGIPYICDGLISTAGALVVCELAPKAKEYLFASHCSVEAGHRYMLERLGLSPLLNLGLRLGEGTGAALAIPLLQSATRILAEIKTFQESGVAEGGTDSY